MNTLNPLNYSPVDVNGELFHPPFSVVYDQLLCLTHIEGEVVVLAPQCQFSDLLPIVSSLVVIRPKTVVPSANGVGVVFANAVLGEQGVQEGTTYTPMRAPVLRISVADMLLPTLTTWRAAHLEVQDPVAEEGV